MCLAALRDCVSICVIMKLKDWCFGEMANRNARLNGRISVSHGRRGADSGGGKRGKVVSCSVRIIPLNVSLAEGGMVIYFRHPFS